MSSSLGNSQQSARFLGSLFGSTRSSSDDGTTRSLAYTAPKEPGSKDRAPAPPPAAADKEEVVKKASASAVQYAYVGRTRLYKLEDGAFAAASPEQLGCVVLGAGLSYQLLVYDASKKHVLAAGLADVVPLKPQANNFVALKARGTTWSAHFDQGSFDFCRAVSLAHAHGLVHMGDPKLTPPAYYELAAEPPDGRRAGRGDSATVAYQAWPLDPASLPGSVVKQRPEKTSSETVVLGENPEGGGFGAAISEAVASARVGAKRACVAFADGAWRWIELDVTDIVSEVVPPPPVDETTTEERRPSIAERMAGLAAAGGVVGIAPIIAPPQAKREPPPIVAGPAPKAAPPSPPTVQQQPEAAVIQETPRAVIRRPPAVAETAVALVPGQGARSHFVEAPRRDEPAPRPADDDAQARGLLAMQASLATQQTQSSLLAVQASLAHVHDKLDRLAQGASSSSSSSYGLHRPSDDLKLLEKQVCGVLREHAALQQRAGDRDAKRSELEDKLDLLREKNAELATEKLAAMEKHADLVSKGADQALRTRALEDASRAAAEERDALAAKVAALELENAKLSERVAAERGAATDLRDQLDAAEAARQREEADGAAHRDNLESAAAKTAQIEAEAARRQTDLEREIEKREATVTFLETRCEDAERNVQRLELLNSAVNKERDDCLVRERDALAQLELLRARQPESALATPRDVYDKVDLVKTIMNDTYKQLLAHFAAGGSDATFSAGDAARAIKATLKSITTKYLTVDGAREPPPYAADSRG
ncbi:hypothetical protein CTAYLR_000280 [Chrysophaeum taylorii]|uniref:Uncharacterized protein n=1 Tax=Chrysophaeum taylorii TaxID=2483200 RepID=A0AAD7UEI6_9STRA|nr:hypothetical protein CTAYLR_000280 [Chrysophaeum taylorii]